MKKTILLFGLLTLTVEAFADSAIIFKNSSTNNVMQWTSQTNSTLISVPSRGGFVTMYWAHNGTPYTPWVPSFRPADWRATNSGWTEISNAPCQIYPVAGHFSGGVYVFPDPMAWMDLCDFVIVGWTGSSTNFDDAYEAAGASNALVGVSSKFSMRPTKLSTPPGTVESISAYFAGLVLSPVSGLPTIYRQPWPQSQTAVVGSTAQIKFDGWAWPAPAYQWYLNETNVLTDQTNGTLVLTNLQILQSGSYTVIMTNVLGSVVSQPAFLSVLPWLAINMAPVITLNGDVGLTYDLQYVNVFGPTNAWNTVAAVTITNNPQVYVDLSATGQPARYYRLVLVP